MAAKKVLAIASTREGEEVLLLAALGEALLAGGVGEMVVILVPRHPQRFDEVAQLIESRGFSIARRSRGDRPDGCQVLLGDTMGEMPSYYAASDAAIIGGTLLPYGGQNLIEACAAGVPVILGPYVHNFSEASRLAVQCGAAIQVASADEAVASARALLDEPVRRESMRAAGLAFSAAHRGATQRHMDAIRGLRGPIRAA